MDLFNNFSEEDIHKIKLIQNLVKQNVKDIKNLNDRMNITYNNVYPIMKISNNNFILGLITQYEYNSELN